MLVAINDQLLFVRVYRQLCDTVAAAYWLVQGYVTSFALLRVSQAPVTRSSEV